MTTQLRVVGWRLARARAKRRLSQQALAALVRQGVGQTTLSKMESGRALTVANLLAVARALGMDPGRFLKGL